MIVSNKRSDIADGLSGLRVDRSWSVRAAMGCLGVAFSVLARAATPTIHMKHSYDPEVCTAFLAMVKAAGIARMTDEQLCDFRFAHLPSSATHGFTFPVWKRISVTDVPAMYFHLLQANVPAHGPFKMGYPWPNLMSAARAGAKDENLDFSVMQAALQNKGKDLTFVQMDIKRCSNAVYKPFYSKSSRQMQPYVKDIGLPFFSVFTKDDIKTPIPIMAAPFVGGQVAFWKKNIPIELTSVNGWVRLPGRKPELILALNGLKRVAAYGSGPSTLDEHVSAYPVCDLIIN